MAYYLCVCCDLCNQEGFIATPIEQRRQSRESEGRRHCDARACQREHLINLAFPAFAQSVAVLQQHMQLHQWKTNGQQLQFCKRCYENHHDEIDCLEGDLFELSVAIIHDDLRAG